MIRDLTPKPAEVSYRQEIGPFQPDVSNDDVISASTVLGKRTVTPEPIVVNVAAELRRPPRMVMPALAQRLNTLATDGEVLAVAKGTLGLGTRIVKAPIAGQITQVLADSGTIIIQGAETEEDVFAACPGTVVAVDGVSVTISISGAAVEGIAGVGPPVSGRLHLVPPGGGLAGSVPSEDAGEEYSSPRIYAFQSIGDAENQLAAGSGSGPPPVGIVVPGMPRASFSALNKTRSGVSTFVARGFGNLAFGDEESDPVWRLLVECDGLEAVFLPASSARPPLLILPGAAVTQPQSEREPAPGDGVLAFRGLQTGVGTILDMPENEVVLSSEILSKAARVKFDDGAVELVPVSSLALIREGAVKE